MVRTLQINSCLQTYFKEHLHVFHQGGPIQVQVGTKSYTIPEGLNRHIYDIPSLLAGAGF